MWLVSAIVVHVHAGALVSLAGCSSVPALHASQTNMLDDDAQLNRPHIAEQRTITQTYTHNHVCVVVTGVVAAEMLLRVGGVVVVGVCGADIRCCVCWCGFC